MASNANLPETLKIRTSDNEVIEVTGKLINESLVIKKLFEKNGNTNEMTIQVKSAELKNAVKALELCDLETPYVSATDSLEKITFKETHHTVMKFFKTLPSRDMQALCNLSSTVEAKRLMDLCVAFMLSLIGNNSITEIRQIYGMRDDCTKEEEDECKKRFYSRYASKSSDVSK